VKSICFIAIMSACLGIYGCGRSDDSGKKRVPRKEWIDIRGTEVVLQSKDGVKLCVAVPNGVFASDHKDSLTIKFEDFNDFSNDSVKHPINFKVGVSSVFIRPESSEGLVKLKLRLLEVGESLIFTMKGFEVFKSKLGDDSASLKIFNIDKKISLEFYSGKLLRDKYKQDMFLTKLITEISTITQYCSEEL
jgi:hypothetical protein